VTTKEDEVFENFEYHTELKWVWGDDAASPLPRQPRESLSAVSHTLSVINEAGKAEESKVGRESVILEEGITSPSKIVLDARHEGIASPSAKIPVSPLLPPLSPMLVDSA